MLACPCTGNIFIRCAHSLAGHSPSKEILRGPLVVGVTDLPALQGLADSASAHVNGQLLLLPQNPGLKKWFGIPVPFSSRLF